MPRRILCNILAAVFSIIIVLPFVMMLLDREMPIVLSNGKIQPDIVQSNTNATVTWNAIRNRKFGKGPFDCQGFLTRRITDAAGFVVETKSQPIESYKLLGETHVSGTFTKELIMPNLLPGIAAYQITTTYWCNPVQKYILPIVHLEETIHFLVGDLNLNKLTGQTYP